MATRHAFRYVSSRLSSSGKVISEEYVATRDAFIRLSSSGQTITEEYVARRLTPKRMLRDPKLSGPTTGGKSTDKNKNKKYAILAGVVTGMGALGWYLKSKDKKSEDLHN